MHPDLRTLYDLQLADTHLRESQQKLEGLDWGDAHRRALKGIRDQAVLLASEKANTEKTLKETEREIAAAQDRIKRTEGRLSKGDIHNAHEMESAEKELETFRCRLSDLEERALVLMEALEKVPQDASTLRAKEQILLRDLAAAKEKAEAEKARLTADIAQVTNRRKELAAKIPAPVLSRYERAREHHGGVAVVRITNGSCGACRVAVPPNIVKDVLETDQLVACLNCSRYLFTDSDTAA